MLIRLHEEVYMPVLLSSVVFETFETSDRSMLVQTCHLAMSESFHATYMDIFIDGTECHQMRVLLTGHSRYFHADPAGGQQITEIEAGVWVSEAVLWVQWVHAGQLIAESPCCVTEFKSAIFRHLLVKRGGALYTCLRTFAIFFVAHAEENHKDDETLTHIIGRTHKFHDFVELQERRGGAGAGLLASMFGVERRSTARFTRNGSRYVRSATKIGRRTSLDSNMSAKRSSLESADIQSLKTTSQTLSDAGYF